MKISAHTIDPSKSCTWRALDDPLAAPRAMSEVELNAEGTQPSWTGRAKGGTSKRGLECSLHCSHSEAAGFRPPPCRGCSKVHFLMRREVSSPSPSPCLPRSSTVPFAGLNTSSAYSQVAGMSLLHWESVLYWNPGPHCRPAHPNPGNEDKWETQACLISCSPLAL
jgi:hypothetical protein